MLTYSILVDFKNILSFQGIFFLLKMDSLLLKYFPATVLLFYNAFHSLHSSLLPHTFPLTWIYVTFVSSSENRGLPRDNIKQDKTRYNKRKWKLSYLKWTRQPKRNKRALRAGRRISNTLASSVWSSIKHQGNRYNTNIEDQVQTHAIPVLAAPGSVSP